MDYEAYHLHAYKIGEVTILKHAISHIRWFYDGTIESGLPDKCVIYLLDGNLFEIWRDETRVIYEQIKG